MLLMQMQCVNLLLKAGAAMTEGQLTIITQALPALPDPKVIWAVHQICPPALTSLSWTPLDWDC